MGNVVDLLLSVLGTIFIVCAAHEFGHVVVAWFYGISVKDYGWSGLKGPWVKRDRHPVQWKDAMITLGGPLANFALAWWAQRFNETMMWEYSLVLAIGNMVPWYGTDGQRLWKMLRSWNDETGRVTGVLRGQAEEREAQAQVFRDKV